MFNSVATTLVVKETYKTVKGALLKRNRKKYKKPSLIIEYITKFIFTCDFILQHK